MNSFCTWWPKGNFIIVKVSVMENSFGLLFYLKKPKNYEDGPIPIYFRITVDGIEKEISTKLLAEPLKWSKESNRIQGKSADVKAINDYLDILHTRAINARTHLTALGKPITADNVRLLVLDKPLEADRTIMPVFKEHNEKMLALVGKDFSPGTMERYDTSYRHTLSFMQDIYKVSDMSLNKLDFTFITDYEHWLKTTRNCDHNTAMKYLSNFKKIVLICVKKKWLPGDPFGEFKMTKRKKKRKVLSQIDLNNIATKAFHSERLAIVRDIFLFSCYTGLAYSDVKKLKRIDIFKGIDGYKWITCTRQKRMKDEGSSNIPLLPAAEKIVNQYWNDPYCIEKGLVLPVRSNQKMNEYLKEIADVCDIRIELTFHIARHTFATTVTLSNKVPIETVSKMLAHERISTTQDYAQVLDNKISDDMSDLRNKYAS